MVNEWTRDDLPAVMDLVKASAAAMATELGGGADAALDAVVAHLNAHHPKPGRDFSGVERDDLRRQVEDLHKRRRKHADERAAWTRNRRELISERDAAVARAEAAEARTTPAVTRADVAEALSRCINPEMWNVTFPSVVSEVCDLFGVEAGQATDPVEEKARELYRAATPDAQWETVADEYRRIAAHVLGEESHD